jgi:hypothetical protein
MVTSFSEEVQQGYWSEIRNCQSTILFWNQSDKGCVDASQAYCPLTEGFTKTTKGVLNQGPTIFDEFIVEPTRTGGFVHGQHLYYIIDFCYRKGFFKNGKVN